MLDKNELLMWLGIGLLVFANGEVALSGLGLVMLMFALANMYNNQEKMKTTGSSTRARERLGQVMCPDQSITETPDLGQQEMTPEEHMEDPRNQIDKAMQRRREAIPELGNGPQPRLNPMDVDASLVSHVFIGSDNRDEQDQFAVLRKQRHRRDDYDGMNLEDIDDISDEVLARWQQT